MSAPTFGPLWLERLSITTMSPGLRVRSEKRFEVGLERPTAVLDRPLHHSQVITIRGDSYRLREKRRSVLIEPAILDQAEVGMSRFSRRPRFEPPGRPSLPAGPKTRLNH